MKNILLIIAFFSVIGLFGYIEYKTLTIEEETNNYSAFETISNADMELQKLRTEAYLKQFDFLVTN